MNTGYTDVFVQMCSVPSFIALSPSPYRSPSDILSPVSAHRAQPTLHGQRQNYKAGGRLRASVRVHLAYCLEVDNILHLAWKLGQDDKLTILCARRSELVADDTLQMAQKEEPDGHSILPH